MRSHAVVRDVTEEGIAYLSVGSNLGDRLYFLCAAVRRLTDAAEIHVGALSSVYETEPVGKADQADFLNAVVQVQTPLPPRRLLDHLLQLERQLGRQRNERWGPRTIDLDLLAMANAVSNDPDLLLPHPRLISRRFVLQPFAEIAPEWVLPGGEKTIAELLSVCPDPHRVDLYLTSTEFRRRIQTI
ncbi:MAG TPA: 2-amino-4-hydroxy-6-hydroxymethyldihydropteridine diphosphokinase [bacterium]|nr:2-amino-4-hydroxy-6-hydroxymethyldihydropteridine diphosphokinase [bacterium]HPN35990.1 2-amino-4-hydroxy-6-hydroxymethyldihydropteridine diphosphokinase [bacterium]